MDNVRPQELAQVRALVLNAWLTLREMTHEAGTAEDGEANGVPINAKTLQKLLGNRERRTHAFLKPLLVEVENDITGGKLWVQPKGKGPKPGKLYYHNVDHPEKSFPLSYRWNAYYAITVVGPWLQKHGLLDDRWVLTEAGANAIESKYASELKAGKFKWSEPRANRYFHPLQQIENRKTGLRAKIFARHGYVYDYDVECCAATVIHQMARQAGSTVETPLLDEFLKDRATVRSRYAAELGLAYEDVKDILLLAFNGQKLNRNTTIRAMLSGVDTYKHKGVVRLERSLSGNERNTFEAKCRILQPFFDEAANLLAIFGDVDTAYIMNEIYFPQEKRILDIAIGFTSYMDKEIFRIHDGFMSVEPIDTELLRKHVFNETGFGIKYECKVFNEKETRNEH